MEYIDTLKAYKDLIEAKVSPEQAEAQVRVLNGAFEGVAMKSDITYAINSLEKDLKIFMGLEIGGLILASLIIPIIAKKWGWIKN